MHTAIAAAIVAMASIVQGTECARYGESRDMSLLGDMTLVDNVYYLKAKQHKGTAGGDFSATVSYPSGDTVLTFTNTKNKRWHQYVIEVAAYNEVSLESNHDRFWLNNNDNCTTPALRSFGTVTKVSVNAV